LHVGGVSHIVGKLSTRASTLLEISPQSKACTKRYEPPKLQKATISRILGQTIWES